MPVLGDRGPGVKNLQQRLEAGGLDPGATNEVASTLVPNSHPLSMSRVAQQEGSL